MGLIGPVSESSRIVTILRLHFVDFKSRPPPAEPVGGVPSKSESKSNRDCRLSMKLEYFHPAKLGLGIAVTAKQPKLPYTAQLCTSQYM